MPKTYTTMLGDMWDTIALKTLGSEMHRTTLMNSNLKHRHIYIFPAEVVLAIPAVNIKPPSSLPPWKRGDGV